MKIATILFAKAPIFGYAKTRISNYFGDVFTLDFYKLILRWQWETIQQLQEYSLPSVSFEYFIYFAKPPTITKKVAIQSFSYLPKLPNLSFKEQVEGALDQKLQAAVENIKKKFDYAIIWGADIPLITIDDFIVATKYANYGSSVIVPANDGGYCLLSIDLRTYHKKIFDTITWSSRYVFKQQQNNFINLKLPLHILDKKPDLDTPQDILRNITYMNQHLNDIYKKRLIDLDSLFVSHTNNEYNQYV